MNNFYNQYLQILKSQVEEEIAFLIQNGHESKHPTNDCPFCYEIKGKNFCNRIKELREFQSRIMVDINTKKLPALNPTTLPLLNPF